MDSTIKLTEVSDVVTPAPETYPENYNFAIESTWEEHIYSEGGGEASGTIDITSNGTHNVAPYASANVQVPNPSTGTKNITTNGDHDVTDYAMAHVDVPQPSGSVNINQNGTHDVTNYASASVNVPNSYASSDEGKVVSNGALVSQTSKTVTQNGTVDTTLNDEVVVNVPTGITPSGSQTFTHNGTYNVESLAEAVVNVASGGIDYTELSVVTIPRGTVDGVAFGNSSRASITLSESSGRIEAIVKFLNSSATHNIWIKDANANSWVDTTSINGSKFTNIQHTTDEDGYNHFSFSFANINSLIFGACWTDTSYSQSNAFKSLKIYNSSNDLIHDIVPAIVYDEPMFYDKITKKILARTLFYNGFVEGELTV